MLKLLSRLNMTYLLHPMRPEDIMQVSELDLQCFPTMMPPVNYKTELINPMAHYLVAYDETPLPEKVKTAGISPLLLGFAGMWLLAGEAHIINLAVRPECRRKGLGELLLMGMIEQAANLKASLITLEMRLSNQTAQRLYEKYGLTRRGVRRAYYTDNREDAAIMTLDEPCSPDMQAKRLVWQQTYRRKWGFLPEIPLS
jgi:[ribosomal protein S18]-alanine N-acetyltransferase